MVDAKTSYLTPSGRAFLSSSQVRVNALRGSRTLTQSTVDLLEAAAAAAAGTASDAGSPRAAGWGNRGGAAEVDATTTFNRTLRGDNSIGKGGGNTSGSRTAATGRPTRIPHGLAATVATFNNGGSAATASARGSATANSLQQSEIDYGSAAPRETMMRSGARVSQAEAAAATAAAESNAAMSAAAEAAAELARQRDPLWKYRQQVRD